MCYALIVLLYFKSSLLYAWKLHSYFTPVLFTPSNIYFTVLHYLCFILSILRRLDYSAVMKPVSNRSCIFQTWSTDIVGYIDQYNATESQAESDIVDRIERHVEAERRDWLIKLPTDIEESLNLSVQCLKKSLECLPVNSTSTLIDRNNVVRRLANVSNELGVFYMNQVITFNNLKGYS